MATFSLYRQAQKAAWSGLIDWASDSVVMTQHTSGYVPNLDTDAWVSALSAEVATGNGYIQGGAPLTGRQASYYPAGSWPDVWAPVTAYVPGQVVRPVTSPGLLYRCAAGGTSGATVPAWPVSAGLTVTDGTVTWTAAGAGAVALIASPLQWPAYQGTFRYLVISDRSGTSASQQPLIAIADMGANVSGAGGALSVTFDSGSGSGIVIPLWAP